MSKATWTRHALEGDGNLTNLFHYLFKKNKNYESCTVRIPDTIVYEHNFPTGWFYFQGQELKKKTGKELETKAIFDELKKNELKNEDKSHGIVAQFLSQCEDENTGELLNKIEFFDRDELEEFLFKRKRRDKGILQRFITPKGMHNFTIQAIWSPNVILTERRVNISKLSDKKISAFERAVTYEGPSHYSQEVLCAPHLEKEIKIFCDNIQQHFLSVEHKPITRMVLYFKVDQKGTLWLLWSSSIRVAAPSKALELAPKFTVPVNENEDRFIHDVDNLDDKMEITPLRATRNSDSDFESSPKSSRSDKNARIDPIMMLKKKEFETPSPRKAPIIDEAFPMEEKVDEKLEAEKDDLAEVLDDLLYLSYSHFLAVTDRPFQFSLPSKLKESFDVETLHTLLSKLNIRKDEKDPEQYVLQFDTSLSKIQHEYAQWKDIVLQEFVHHYEQKRFEEAVPLHTTKPRDQTKKKQEEEKKVEVVKQEKTTVPQVQPEQVHEPTPTPTTGNDSPVTFESDL